LICVASVSLMTKTAICACGCGKKIAVNCEKHLKDLDTGQVYIPAHFKRIHGNPEQFMPKSRSNQAGAVVQAAVPLLQKGAQVAATAIRRRGLARSATDIAETARDLKAKAALRPTPPSKENPKLYKRKKAEEIGRALEEQGYDVTIFPMGKKWAVRTENPRAPASNPVPKGWEVYDTSGGRRVAGPFETERQGWEYAMQHGGPDALSVEPIEGIANPEDDRDIEEFERKYYPPVAPGERENPFQKKFDDLQVPDKIYKCVKCRRILLQRSKYCADCGAKQPTKNPSAEDLKKMSLRTAETYLTEGDVRAKHPAGKALKQMGQDSLRHYRELDKMKQIGWMENPGEDIEGLYIGKFLMARANPDPEQPPAQTPAPAAPQRRFSFRDLMTEAQGRARPGMTREQQAQIMRTIMQEHGVTMEQMQQQAMPHAAYHVKYTKIKPAIVKIVRDFIVRQRPWRGTAEEKQAKFDRLLLQLSESYGMRTPTLHISDPEHAQGSGFYNQATNHIELPHYSVVTLLHEFKHAMQHQLGQPQNEEVARGWSLSLFYKAAPKHFAKGVERAIIFFITPEDLPGHPEPMLFIYAESPAPAVPILAPLKARLEEMAYRTDTRDGPAKLTRGGQPEAAKLLYTNAPSFVTDRALKYHLRVPDDTYRGEVEPAQMRISAKGAKSPRSNPIEKVKGVSMTSGEYHRFVDYLNENDVQDFTQRDVVRWLEFDLERKARANPDAAGAAAEVASMAAMGATMGSVVPGVGTAIGAGVGAGAGVAKQAIGAIQERRKKKREAIEAAKTAEAQKKAANPEDAEAPEALITARDLM